MDSKQHLPLGGRLKHFIPFWENITNDKIVLDMLDGLKVPLIDFKRQTKMPRHINMNKEEMKFVDQKIVELLKDKCIVKTKFDPSGWVSNIFLRHKKSGGKRMILNLKQLNVKIPDQYFKMEQIRDAQRLISANAFMIMLDIENAYFHLGIKEQYTKYMQFEWMYKFVTLANGVKFGPLVFTKVCKPILGHCRQMGIKILMYIDDIFVTAATRKECENHQDYVIGLLLNCGLL